MVGAFLPTHDKQRWIAAEFAAGVKDIEVTSYIPPRLLPQFADAEEVTRFALGLQGLSVCALVPNLKGAERGLALGVSQLNYVQSASESHNQANVRRSTLESIADLQRVVDLRDAAPPGRRPRIAAGLATAFGCTIEGPVDEGRVIELAARVLETGVEEIVMADTVGYGQPSAVRSIFTAVCRMAKGRATVGAHFHDTRGLGLANVLAALDAGVRHFDASLGGLGGCPHAPGASGNIAMEDCVFMLESMGLDTGIDIEKLLAVRGDLRQSLPGETLLGVIARAGLPKGYHSASASQPSS